jgi:ADP-ribosylglycohydrolase
MTVTDEVLDRARGVLLGAACGDALGVPYEFASRLAADATPEMIGGGLGPYAPGEYSDDTQMHAVIAQVAATGMDLRSDEALRAVAIGFLEWYRHGASDIGVQTRKVLEASLDASDPLTALRHTTERVHASLGRSAGNGSLMRTGVLALVYLDDAEALADAARLVSGLTHYDPLAAEACVIWCEGVRRAVLEGSFDGVRGGLDLLPSPEAARWKEWLDEAEAQAPQTFAPNGFVVRALQAAWSAICSVPVPASDPRLHYERALYAAVRVGDDTDTVAAIAGALLGGRWGASAVPSGWRKDVHGWPGLRADDLIALTDAIVRGPDAAEGGPD